ncbi:hypothetical protein OG883_45530 [Streptomyces sp. NBC_01142]|uniref:DUF6927 domain-containing protein n=1 Tax=Streptomyces sp. NBC_01142 TaxID=2975865 RepID=UPI002251A60A|nr:hypothetical protein [Streptomyces sp. NBC_01142]MCX4826902.1 hypothetical protein [Streptomyces sp. NBC_01142]
MGWTTYRREKNAETDVEHFGAKLNPRFKIIAHGTVAGVFYAAIREETTSEVTAYVALTHWSRDPLFNFGYKDMSETCLPGDHRAPKSVLNALTPTTHEDALTWRAHCRDYHAQRDLLREHLKPGVRVRLTHTLTFTDGTRSDTFTYTRRGRSTHGLLTIGRSHYRIPNWRDSVTALITPDHRETLTPVGRRQATNQPATQTHAAEPQPQNAAAAA